MAILSDWIEQERIPETRGDRNAVQAAFLPDAWKPLDVEMVQRAGANEYMDGCPATSQSA